MILRFKGGEGSGNFQHAGRLGEVGGSTKRVDDYAIVSYFAKLHNKYNARCKFDMLEHPEDKYDWYLKGSNGAFNPVSKVIALDTNMLAGKPEDTGGVPSGSLNNTSRLGWKFLIAHEYGHAVDIANKNVSLKDEWSAIVADYNTQHPFDVHSSVDEDKYIDNESVISKYSLSIGYAKYIESFAEAFAVYEVRPSWLQDKQPKMYAYFDNLLRGDTVQKSNDAYSYPIGFVEVNIDGEYHWVDAQGNEYDVVEKQLPIDDQSRSNLISVRIGIFNNTVDNLSEQMYTGSISLGQWEEAMKAEIRALHTSTAVIGKGAWEDMTQSDWGRVGQQIRQQYRFLHNFSDVIAEKRDTLSLRAIQARAQLYGNASKNTAAVAQAGEFAGGTRRQPGRFKGLPWMPGDGSTECLVGCKCHWKLDIVDTTKDWKLVQCVWTLTPAEHCDDCLERRGYTEIIKVPADVNVPSTIGGL